jgi:hypothetical protein
VASIDQHLTQWRHNRRFAKSIDAAYRDWQINAIVYTALHAVDAAVARLGLRVTDHETRNEIVRTNSSFAAIRKPFHNLYRISRVTRYDADPDLWLPAEYLTVADLVENLLRPIENGLEPLLGKAIRFQPLPLPS